MSPLCSDQISFRHVSVRFDHYNYIDVICHYLNFTFSKLRINTICLGMVIKSHQWFRCSHCTTTTLPTRTGHMDGYRALVHLCRTYYSVSWPSALNEVLQVIISARVRLNSATNPYAPYMHNDTLTSHVPQHSPTWAAKLPTSRWPGTLQEVLRVDSSRPRYSSINVAYGGEGHYRSSLSPRHSWKLQQFEDLSVKPEATLGGMFPYVAPSQLRARSLSRLLFLRCRRSVNPRHPWQI